MWLMQNKKKYSCLAEITAHELWTAVTEKGALQDADAPSEFRRKRAALIKDIIIHRNTDASPVPMLHGGTGGLLSIKLAVYS